MNTVEKPRRTTVYLNAELHRALRLKSAETQRSVSDLINESLALSLAEDEVDLRIVRERSDDPVISYEEMLGRLKADGKL